jgi:basic membrane lipoprotein Med (substrate-binding protein (PBP1-ABC) superfamily)
LSGVEILMAALPQIWSWSAMDWFHKLSLPAIGADVDQYITDPEIQSALISSALKNVDGAVYNYLKAVAHGSVKAGISTGTLQNGGGWPGPFP